MQDYNEDMLNVHLPVAHKRDRFETKYQSLSTAAEGSVVYSGNTITPRNRKVGVSDRPFEGKMK